MTLMMAGPIPAFSLGSTHDRFGSGSAGEAHADAEEDHLAGDLEMDGGGRAGGR
jgi:hypothetical protein